MSNFMISRVSKTHSFFSKLGKDSLDKVSLVARNALDGLSKNLFSLYKIIIWPVVFIKDLSTIFIKYLVLSLEVEDQKSHSKILNKELKQLISFLIKNEYDKYPFPGSRFQSHFIEYEPPANTLQSDIDEIVGVFKSSGILSSDNVQNVLKVFNRVEVKLVLACLRQVFLTKSYF